MKNKSSLIILSILILSIPTANQFKSVKNIHEEKQLLSLNNNQKEIKFNLKAPQFSYDIEKYHNSTEHYLLAQRLASEYGVNLSVIGHSWEGNPIYVLEITKGDPSGKPWFLIIGLHHAREWISAEAAFYVAAYFASMYGIDDNITDILDNLNVAIIPVMNPDGLDIALYENEWQRKNARPIDEDGDNLTDEDPPEDANGDGYIEMYYYQGYPFPQFEGIDNDEDGYSGEDWIGGVDLNRNYPYAWGEVYGHQYPESEVYQGPEPASEPEVKAIMSYMTSRKPIIAISLHSGIEKLLYPWGYWEGYSNFEEDLYIDILYDVYKATGWSFQPASRLYPASGVWDDWAFGDLHCLAFTAEIYGNNHWPKMNQTDEGFIRYGIKWMFNPNLDTELLKFNEVLDNTLKMAIVTASHSIEISKDETEPVIILPNELQTYLESDKLETLRDRVIFNVSIMDQESGIFDAKIILKSNQEIVKVFEGSIPLYNNSWVLEINKENLSTGSYLIYLSITNRAKKSIEIRLGGLNITSDGKILIDWDLDNDHLADAFEMLHGANPDNPDTDDDGIKDGEEYKSGGWNAVLSKKSAFSLIQYVAIAAILIAIVIMFLVFKKYRESV